MQLACVLSCKPGPAATDKAVRGSSCHGHQNLSCKGRERDEASTAPALFVFIPSIPALLPAENHAGKKGLLSVVVVYTTWEGDVFFVYLVIL
jgi:hypothetical protein